MRKKYRLISLLIIILIPQTILANAGTALMWMPIMQLLIGNIVIGIVEGFFVALIFKTKWIRSILIMIGGNYVSWLLGNGLISLFQNYLIDTLFKLDKVFVLWIASLVILYILTVIIELPFFRWTFDKNERNWFRPLKLSIILNTFTYTAMIIIYLNVSKYNFFTDLNINQSLLDNKSDYELYFRNDKEILQGQINQPGKYISIYNVPDSIEYLRFHLEEDTLDKAIDLFLVNYYGDTLLFKNSFISSSEKRYYPILEEKYSRLFSDFRDTLSRDWKASAGGWAVDGLVIRDVDNNVENYAFEVPWMFWNIGQVSIINETELVCVINGRIILLNKDTKEIAYIAKGYDYILKLKN